MQVYSYNPSTKEYIGTTIAFESPLEKGVYHYPAYTTTTVPPENNDKDNKMIIWDDSNKKWSIVNRPPREKTFEELRQEEIDNYVPPTPMQLLRSKRDKKLKQADWMAMRALTTTGVIPEELKIYMQELRDLPSISDPKSIKEDSMLYLLDETSVNWPVLPENF